MSLGSEGHLGPRWVNGVLSGNPSFILKEKIILAFYGKTVGE